MTSPPDLNDRQRAYLLAIFEIDQEVEADMRAISYRPFQERPKASEWRWLDYLELVAILGRAGSPSSIAGCAWYGRTAA
jgi:hypothetical protein